MQMLCPVQKSILQDVAAFRGIAPIDFAQVDFAQPGKGRHWWRLWGVAAEVAGLFPTYLSPELLRALRITPVSYVPDGCVPIRMYGGEWGLHDLWADTSRLLFPDTHTEYVGAYSTSAHTDECVNPNACNLECIAYKAWVHLGLSQ